MKLSIIAAVAANGVIGNNNQLPWHYPKDMKHFVEITKKIGVVVMGRKTYESIGKPLPNRINIVISRTMESSPGVIVYNHIETVMTLCRYMEREVIVIGGDQLYRYFLPFADTLYITNINAPYVGDSYFPEVSYLEWKHIAEEKHDADDKHTHPFSFDTYVRNHG
jgi:dihydrofolate reductase